MKAKLKKIGGLGNIEVYENEHDYPFADAKFTYSLDGKPPYHYYKTVDGAFLGGLERKYLGLNSQFAEFAIKMLNIEGEK